MTGGGAIPARDGRRRVVITSIRPELECGRFPVKRVAGDTVVVEADVFADGHDELACVLRYRREGRPWQHAPMRPLVNDRWRGEFAVPEIGGYRYRITAWIDRFATWRRDLEKRLEAGQEAPADLLIGAGLVESGARRASGAAAAELRAWARRLRSAAAADAPAVHAMGEEALGTDVAALMAGHPDRRFAVISDRELAVVVDPVRARFSTWYEMFPRSAAAEPWRHGTFRDVEARLTYVESMGFDVLYLPPIHPIGRAYRKGKNNALEPGPEDPGSPWAIGSPEGGHTAIHPDLGTLPEFDHLVAAARDHGLEIALDIAFQCSPDHPWVFEHPAWFRHRPDGSIQYAENPPKKYQDIYPLDFETADWRGLWTALREVFRFWIAHGVRIFRVDNPHTKPFAFWEWVIGSLKDDHPDLIFLSEAFTRPKVMYRLAKVGFSQSYTYFAWRNTKWELTQYFTELSDPEVRDFFRPNLWPNTPDILTEALQNGGRAMFMARFGLAATLGASYGIYGPAFEHLEATPAVPGKEEYLNSEKYEIRWWDPDRPDSLAAFIGRVNRIRRAQPALQSDAGLRFHPVDNDLLLAYSKSTPDRSNVILTVVNLDPHHIHAGWVELPLADMGIDPVQPYQAHDLLTDARYLWAGPRNYVQLNPSIVPLHILLIRHRVRSERDFEYFE